MSNKELTCGGIDFVNYNNNPMQFDPRQKIDVTNYISNSTNPELNWEDRWNFLKQYLINYKIEKSGMMDHQRDVFRRCCIALSIDEIFDKMCEIEKM